MAEFIENDDKEQAQQAVELLLSRVGAVRDAAFDFANGGDKGDEGDHWDEEGDHGGAGADGFGWHDFEGDHHSDEGGADVWERWHEGKVEPVDDLNAEKRKRHKVEEERQKHQPQQPFNGGGNVPTQPSAQGESDQQDDTAL